MWLAPFIMSEEIPPDDQFLNFEDFYSGKDDSEDQETIQIKAAQEDKLCELYIEFLHKAIEVSEDPYDIPKVDYLAKQYVTAVQKFRRKRQRLFEKFLSEQSGDDDFPSVVNMIDNP